MHCFAGPSGDECLGEMAKKNVFASAVISGMIESVQCKSECHILLIHDFTRVKIACVSFHRLCLRRFLVLLCNF